MPIYEYVCLDCKKEFEIIRPISQAEASLVCIACGGDRLKRKLALVTARSGEHTVSDASGAATCGSCSGGSCSTCGH